MPGEWACIERLRAALGGARRGLEGIGDDGVVLRPSDGRVVVLDTMVEEVHFRRAWSSPADVAWKLVASNVSDLWAMGAAPRAWLLSMSLDDPSWWLPGLEEGFVAAVAAMAPDAALVGGDTTRAEAGRVVLSATFVGATDAVVSRAGARPGDDVWVDGPLGWAAAGLEALRRGEGDVAGLEEMVRAHRRPALHRGAGPVRGARAAIDVSDGLAADLTHVARASGVAMEIRLPLPGHEALEAVGRRWGLDPVAWQLGGGDDYVRVAVGERPHGRSWTRVGTARADGPPLTVLGADGSRTTLGPAGYRHFPT